MRVLTHLAAATIGALLGVTLLMPAPERSRSEHSRGHGARADNTGRVVTPPARGRDIGRDGGMGTPIVEGADSVEPHEEIGSGPEVATDDAESPEGLWRPPAPHTPKTSPIRPPTIPEIRAAKMIDILVEANLNRPGTESERLLHRLEKIRMDTLTALEPVRRRLRAELQFSQRSFRHSPKERDLRLRLARQRVVDAMLAVAPREAAMRALRVSPAVANAADD